MRQFNINPIIIKAVALSAVVTLALCVLIRVGVSDYQARAVERQVILDQAQHFKTHPLVVNGCDTDLECERLDDMLAVIHASYE